MSYHVFQEIPMTAPDSRDSVLLPCPFCGSAAELRREHGRDVSLTWIECSACPIRTTSRGWLGSDEAIVDALADAWNNLQALARGPQQAGGEYDWKAAHEALESMDDFARMDKGVAPHGPYAVLRDLLTKAKAWKESAEAAEAALREAGRDAERWRFLTSMDVGEYIGLVEYNNPDKLAAAIDAARLVRDGDSGEG